MMMIVAMMMMIIIVNMITRRQRFAQCRREDEGRVVASIDPSFSWTEEILGT